MGAPCFSSSVYPPHAAVEGLGFAPFNPAARRAVLCRGVLRDPDLPGERGGILGWYRSRADMQTVDCAVYYFITGLVYARAMVKGEQVTRKGREDESEA